MNDQMAQTLINDGFDDPSVDEKKLRQAVDYALEGLDQGRLRVAQKARP